LKDIAKSFCVTEDPGLAAGDKSRRRTVKLCRNRFGWIFLVAGVPSLLGCEEGNQTAQAPTTTVVPPPAVASDSDASPIVESQPAPVVAPPLPPAPNGSPAAKPVDERTVAEVGVGAKGRYDSNDYVSTVVSSYFGIQERLAFDLAKRGLSSFKAEHGDYPKTHEEYWKEVIEANSIALPELPDGEEYYYDYEQAKASRGEEALFVVKPKR
jgi:hypothetical protein